MSIFAYLYVCVFVYLCICVFVYLYICICLHVYETLVNISFDDKNLGDDKHLGDDTNLCDDGNENHVTYTHTLVSCPTRFK